ncbi:MAG: flagellar basal body protein FliL [Azospirillum sp.]|nr:flagellar basal body protein FliL [Azospirillum sp.]
MAHDNDADSGMDGGEDLPRRKFSGKKMILFIVLPLLLLLGAGAGLYFSGILGGLMGEKPPEHAAEAEHPPEEPISKEPIFFDVPDMLVNLNTSGRRPTFLKVSISLQINRHSDQGALEKVMPRIIDNFQVYLRELRLEDLKGSAGMYRLREELLTRVAAAAYPVKVKDVLFREMLIQ